MVFLKLVHREYRVNPKTQPFWVKAVHLVPNVQTWHHRFGTIDYPPFQHAIKSQEFIPALDFSFFAKIRLEIANI